MFGVSWLADREAEDMITGGGTEFLSYSVFPLISQYNNWPQCGGLGCDSQQVQGPAFSATMSTLALAQSGLLCSVHWGTFS